MGLSCVFYAMHRLQATLPKQTPGRLHELVELVRVYHAIITSVFLYASPVHGHLPSKLLTKLERLQKRAHCGQTCECDLFPSVDSRIRDAAIKLLLLSEVNRKHPLRKHPFVPRRLPASSRFCVPMCSTNRRLNSFLPWTTELYNSRFNLNISYDFYIAILIVFQFVLLILVISLTFFMTLCDYHSTNKTLLLLLLLLQLQIYRHTNTCISTERVLERCVLTEKSFSLYTHIYKAVSAVLQSEKMRNRVRPHW